MYERIMVPLDGSEFAASAVPVAGALARASGATLHLVRAHELPILPENPAGMIAYSDEWDRSLRRSEREYLDAAAGRVGADVRVHYELVDGPAADGLGRYAGEHGIDLIVMTTHGRGGISRAWIGSVADALVRRCSIPILLLRARERETGPRVELSAPHVLVSLDGSQLSESVVDHALELGAVTGARFTLLRVILPTQLITKRYVMQAPSVDEEMFEAARARAGEELEALAQRLRATGAHVDTEVVSHPLPAWAILDFADTHEVDLIAMATHGRGGWRRLALGSVSDKVLRAAMQPVLLFRPPHNAEGEDADVELKAQAHVHR